MLRSLREEMGIRGGVDNLPWNFTATFGLMLVAVPLYSRLVARVPRARAVPLVYRFFLVTLLVFWALFRAGVAPAPLARAFFVWVSVYGLFVVSVFWSLLVDLFTTDQGKRLFGLVAAGRERRRHRRPALRGVPGRARRRGQPGPRLGGAPRGLHPVDGPDRPLVAPERRGGGPGRRRTCGRGQRRGGRRARAGAPGAAWRSSSATATSSASPAQMLLFTLGSTLLYFQVAHLVAASGLDSASRTRLFARVDLAVNVAALLTGSLATGRIVSRLGLGAALALVPALTAGGFAIAAGWPTFWVLAAFQALRRAASYAVERPAREVLYTVVTREERYKSKAFVDTVVYRAGDAGSAWLARGLTAAGVGVAGSLLFAVPVGLAGVGLALWLAREERRREPSGPPEASAG